MRPAVEALICKGVLPPSTASVQDITDWQEAVEKIEPPLSDEEAAALSTLFPAEDDDCFELAWTLIHLVETAPHWPLVQCLNDHSNPWITYLRERARLSTS